MRLRWEVKGLFKDWLERHYPLKGKHVMARIRDLRGGRENNSRFGSRMKGEGEYAELLRKRFDLACKRPSLHTGKRNPLDTIQYRRVDPPPGIRFQDIKYVVLRGHQ